MEGSSLYVSVQDGFFWSLSKSQQYNTFALIQRKDKNLALWCAFLVPFIPMKGLPL